MESQERSSLQQADKVRSLIDNDLRGMLPSAVKQQVVVIVMTIAWGGICCSKPPGVTISLRQAA